MKTHLADVEAARQIHRQQDALFPYLSEGQLRLIKERADHFRSWYLNHPVIHNFISLFLISGLFIFDFWVLTQLPEQLSWESGLAQDIIWGIVIGALHGWILCGMVTLSVHEAATHNLLFQGNGKIIQWLRWAGNNACRLSVADPIYYRQGHKQHHHYFGTEKDGSFSNFVRVRRLFISLIPASPLLSFSDYFPWRPQEKTASRKLSSWMGKAYMIIYAIIMVPKFGAIFTLITLLMMGAWTSYILDRVRESSEHLFMPLDKNNGTRQLGIGFWGMLLGGGPWGQPCHMSHHLAPGLPWYLQLRLHFSLKRILTNEQKSVFFLTPFIGFPRLFIRLMKEGKEISNKPLIEKKS